MSGKRTVSRRETLLECLDLMRKIRNGFSQKGYGITPIMRYIELYDEYDQKCEIIREIIRSMESENVQRALADWRKEIMEAQKEQALKLDAEGPKKPDGYDDEDEKGNNGPIRRYGGPACELTSD